MSTLIACHKCGTLTPEIQITCWGMGAKRCPTCSEAWRTEVYEKRLQEWKAEVAARAAHAEARDAADGTCPDDGIVCESCCDHSDQVKGICPDCDADLRDGMASDQYDRMKYGGIGA